MRRLNAEMMQNAMNARGLSDESLAAHLKTRGYDADPHKIRKMRTKSLQPPADKIALLEQVLGSICDNPRPRRVYDMRPQIARG